MSKSSPVINTDSNQKSRAKYDCPKSLMDLIFWANKIPSDFPLPEISSIPFMSDIGNIVCNKNEAVGGMLGSNCSDDEFKRMVVWELFFYSHSKVEYIARFFISVLKDSSKAVGKPIKSLEEALYQPDLVERFMEDYSTHREAVSSLIKIAKASNEIRLQRKSKADFGNFNQPNFLCVGNDNKFFIVSDSYLFNLLEGLDATRLRLCEICENIFWANRKDKETCSLQCANNLRARRFRNSTAEEKAERNITRAKNREYVKNSKAKLAKRKK